jgi:hypothetical protein
MHSGVRSATELLQQEIGQAGRIALPTGTTTLTAAVSSTSTTATVASSTGMFLGELLVVGAKGIDSNDSSSSEETVKITAISGNTITINQITSNGVAAANFHYGHQAGALVQPAGGFGTGVVPPNITNGSTAGKLKLYGDINGDKKMVYIEYTCDTSTNVALYRMMLDWNASPSAKPSTLTPDLVLLNNVVQNPPATSGGAAIACFQYQMDPTNTYVLDVAVTLTVQSQSVDPITKKYQKETKALLNVSPRNVIGTWQAAGGNIDRVQPMPSSIQALLP